MPTLPTLREILPSPQASLFRAAKAFRVTWSKRIRDREGLLKRRNRAIVAFSRAHHFQAGYNRP